MSPRHGVVVYWSAVADVAAIAVASAVEVVRDVVAAKKH